MEKDGGLDDLFGALGDAESREPAAESEEANESAAAATSPSDASAALNAAFIEAATAPVEPLIPATPATEPEPASEAGEPGEAVGAPEAADADSHPALLPATTRRELRERQRAGETGAIGVAGMAATMPSAAAEEAAEAVESAPVGGEPVIEQPIIDEPMTEAPAVEESIVQEPVVAAPVADELVAEEPIATDPEGFVPFIPAEPHEPHEPAADAQAPADDAAPADPEPADAADIAFSESSYSDADLAALSTAPTTAGEQSAAGGEREPLLVSSAPRQQAGRGFPIRLEPPVGGGPRKQPWWLFWAVPLMIIVLLIGYVGVYLFTHIKEPGWNILGFQVPTAVEEKVRELLGWEIPNDYEGTGNGVEVVVTILPGDFGDDVAITLQRAGVTKTFDAFHDLLLELAEQGEEPSFLPGNYRLEEEMSAQSALDALLDPANRIQNRVIIPEGSNLPDTLAILAGQTGLPLEDFTAAAADLSLYGLPGDAVSLEGYLFPASYDLDGTETAVALLQRLVNETFTRLDALGVAPENRNSFLTLASIVQKESGPNPEDPPKIARVFQNRIDQGIMLESDATTTYGTCVWGPTQGREAPDTCGTVWLNQADIDDTTNPYNTRALPGLPPGPIAMPGQAALEAVAHPADGPWLFFVAVNLATGETVFSTTVEEHEAAVDQLYAWCEASDENASYCA